MTLTSDVIMRWLTTDVIMRCDDLVFQSDTNNNQVRYRTRATWWRSRPAHNLQRSNGAGPPCHPRTPPKAAQPTAQSPQPVKKEFGDVTSRYSTRQGGFSPPRDVRFLCAYHTHKARSLSTRLGRRAHWAPAGGMVGPLFRQTDGVTHVLDSGSTS